MSYTDLRFVGNQQGPQLKKSHSMKKSRSLSLTNISSIKRNSYDHVESKVKRYIKEMKENNGAKISNNLCNDNIIRPDIMTVNIDADILKKIDPSTEASSTELLAKVKLLTSSPVNLENKVEFISKKPEAVYCLLGLLFEERKLRYEQDLTMRTLQLNYDNLLAKYANAKNSIDSFRFSQEVLTDLKSNSSFLSGTNFSSNEIKRAYSTPDLSLIDISTVSDMLIKTSYVPVVDPNMSIKLCMENISQNKILHDKSSTRLETDSKENLKTIWMQIFQNLREKLKKCVLLEKNMALEGEDKKAAWNSIYNDFKCLSDIANYQEDITSSYGGELEDITFAIHEYSKEYLGISLIVNNFINKVESHSAKTSNIMKNNHVVTSQPVSKPNMHQIRPEVQVLDKIIGANSRENDSGCLTSDCSPHPSLNNSKHNKPYYTFSNNSTECKNSDSSLDNKFNFNDNLFNNSNGLFYNDCSNSYSSSKDNWYSSDQKFLGSSVGEHSGENLVECSIPSNNSASLHRTIHDSIVSSPDDTQKQRKYSAVFVTKSVTPDSTPPSSRKSSPYDFTRLKNNSDLLKQQLKGKGLLKEEKNRSPKRNIVGNPHKKLPSKSSASNKQQPTQMPLKLHRSLKKHRSMQSIYCNNDENLKSDFDAAGCSNFYTSTPKKSSQSANENSLAQMSTTNFKWMESHVKERRPSLRQRSKSLFHFGKEIKEVLEITEVLKKQSMELLSKYKTRSEAPRTII